MSQNLIWLAAREVEAALGEVLCPVRGEIDLPCRIDRGPTAVERALGK